MNCDCIERIERLLTKKMQERFPDGEVTEMVQFQNKTLIFADKESKLILSNPTIGRVRIKKSIRKYETQMLPKFCPYCGKPLFNEGGKK